MALSTKDFQKLQQVILELHSLDDHESFGPRILALLSQIIPNRMAAYTEVDPVLSKSTGHLYPADFADIRTVAPLFQKHIADHPVVKHVQDSRDGRARAISDFYSVKRFHATGLYREIFLPMKLEDQLSIAMVGSGGMTIGISFNRSKRGFTQRERSILDILRPHILRAFLNCRDRRFLGSVSAPEIARAVNEIPVGLIYVRADGRIDWETLPARRLLQSHFPDRPASIHGLPDPIRNWIQVGTRNQWYNMAEFVFENASMQLRISAIRQRDDDLILVLHQLPLEQQSIGLDELGLSGREQDVLRQIIQDRSAHNVAKRLAISQRTVDKHLERIFRKLGVKNLASAIATVLARTK